MGVLFTLSILFTIINTFRKRKHKAWFKISKFEYFLKFCFRILISYLVIYCNYLDISLGPIITNCQTCVGCSMKLLTLPPTQWKILFGVSEPRDEGSSKFRRKLDEHVTNSKIKILRCVLAADFFRGVKN